jgi:hypothetical protein
MTKRFIQIDDLPKTLWCKNTKLLFLPPMLVDSWKSLLLKNGLEEMAKTKVDESFVGGVSKEDTDKHLAWRYNGSCGRLILSLLGSDKKLDKISDAYATTFAGNKVFLADLPCGSGAATVSILTTLAELRKQSVIPRTRLVVVIVAGDISDSARDYFLYQLDALRPLLEEQAIYIEYETIYWNVLDPMNTANLTTKLILSSQGCDSRLLVLSNFTGFLESSGNWKKAQPQLNNVFLHSRDEISTAIWIEPQKSTVPKFMNKVFKWFKDLFKDESTGEDMDVYAQVENQFRQPIKEDEFPVRLTVMRFDLPIGESE